MLRRLALAGGLAAFSCPTALHAAEIHFTSGSEMGATLEVAHLVKRGQDPLAPVQVRLQLGGIEVERTSEGFNAIKASGLTPLGRLGLPDLAGTGVLLALPPGVEARVELLSHQQRELEALPVQPCQPSARCARPEPLAFHFDSRVYDSTATFPASPAALEEIGQVQGMRLVRVALYPLRMHMKKRSLEVSTELTAEVRFSGTAAPVELPSVLRTMVLSTASNGKQIAAAVPVVTGPERMILVVADKFKTLLAPFVEWKRQRGLIVSVYGFSEAGGTRDKLKAFLQKEYNSGTPKPTYLLLVGNSSTLPGYMNDTGSGAAASDYPYSLLDGGDPLPDLLYGRLLADNDAEVNTQVKRWIEYEKDTGNDWASNAMTLASQEGKNPSDEEYAGQIGKALTKYTYTNIDPFFERNRSATNTHIFDALKEGRSWVAYFGHGTGTDWASTNDFFGVGDVDQVQNGGRLPFIVDVACQNGSWVNIKRCFGKAWVTLEQGGKPAGAIAYYGGSVDVSWHEPATMSVGVAKYHFEKPVHSVGASVFAGQLYLMEKMGMGENTKDNLKWYNLFGDPSLLLRTHASKPYSIAYEITPGMPDSEISVRVNDAFGLGFAGVQTSVYLPGENGPAAVGTTDKSGYALLTLKGKPAVPPTGTLTASGYNLETYQVPLLP